MIIKITTLCFSFLLIGQNLCAAGENVLVPARSGAALRPLASSAAAADDIGFFLNKKRYADYKSVTGAIEKIRSKLEEVDAGLSKRRYVNPEIEAILSGITRNEKPLFKNNQSHKIARVRKLKEKLSLLSYYLLLNDNNDYLFRPSYIFKLLIACRQKSEVEFLIEELASFGIKKGSHIAGIISSSGSRHEIVRAIKRLYSLGIRKPAHIAMVMRGSRKEDDIEKTILCLKSLGIDKDIHQAMVLQGARSAEEIRRVAESLKPVGIEDSYSLAVILKSAKKEEDILPFALWLKGLGIERPSNIALIIQRDRNKSDIKQITGMLRSFGIREELHITNILLSSREQDNIKKIIELLREEMALSGSELGSVASKIMRSSRGRKDILGSINAIRSFGIKHPGYIAMILQSSRGEPEIRRLLEYFSSYGITGGNSVTKIMLSSRKEREIKDIVKYLYDMGMTKDSQIANVIRSTRPGKMIKKIAGILLAAVKKNNGYNRLSNSLIANLAARPKRLKKILESIYERKGELPVAGRPLTEEDKEYIRYRLILRNIDMESLFLLAELLVKNKDKLAGLKAYINRQAADDRSGISVLLPKKTLSENDHIRAGLLLFSFDSGVRMKMRNKLAEDYAYLLKRYKKNDSISVASNILMLVCTHYNIYHNMMKDMDNGFDLKAYLTRSLGYVGIVHYNESLPESIRGIRKEIRDFARKEGLRSNDKGYYAAIVSEFSRRGYDMQAVQYALGMKMLSLDKPLNGSDNALIDYLSEEDIQDNASFVIPHGYEKSSSSGEAVRVSPDKIISKFLAKRTKDCYTITKDRQILRDAQEIPKAGFLNGRKQSALINASA